MVWICKRSNQIFTIKWYSIGCSGMNLRFKIQSKMACYKVTANDTAFHLSFWRIQVLCFCFAKGLLHINSSWPLKLTRRHETIGYAIADSGCWLFLKIENHMYLSIFSNTQLPPIKLTTMIKLKYCWYCR
jgi:hypothetical protein